MWFLRLMREFFFGMDKIVYNFIPKVYDLLITIARTSPLSQKEILGMADRIYKFLAVFMVFKVTLSLITYVVNPDDFSDKTKGVSKLATNAIISLCVLILTPYIFNYAYQFQTMILEDNSLAILVFGEENKKGFFNKAGEEMSFITISAFFSPDSALSDLGNCAVLTQTNLNGKVVFNQSCSGLDGDYNPLGTETGLYLKTIDNEHFDEKDLKNYVAGVEGRSLGLMFRREIATASDKDNEHFIIDYQWLLSTVVGVVIILLLITFCMDVGVRSIKLAFLQLIAPIPILSYVDPKSGKDGLFKKWYEMCFKTYLSLFIRLLAVYFAVYIISIVADLQFVDVITGAYQNGFLVKVFIIIGALMFAKQLPKILEGLGIKLDGDGKFFLNPFKKFEEQAIGGKKILGAGKGLAAGAMVGTAGMLTGAGLGRGVAAMFGGVKSGIQGKKFGEIRKDQVNKNAEMRRAIASGSTFLGRRAAAISGYFGLPGGLGRIEHDKIQHENNRDNLRAQKAMIQDKIKPKQDVIAAKKQIKSSVDGMESYVTGLIEGGKAGKHSKKFKQLQTDAAYLQNNIGQTATHDILDAEGHRILEAGKTITADVAYAMNGEDQRYSKKVGRAELTNEMLSGLDKSKGGQVSAEDLRNFQGQKSYYDQKVEDYNAAVRSYNETADADDQVVIEETTAKTSFDEMHAQAGEMDNEIRDIETSISAQEEEIRQIEREISSEEVQIQEYAAKEKRAKANVQATHSSEGGPANPSDIVPPEYTVSRRSGGPGSGRGPMGPWGPGPGPGPGGRP